MSDWRVVFDGVHPVLFVVVASWLLGVACRHGEKRGAFEERQRICSEGAEAAAVAYMLDERHAILRVAEEMSSLAQSQLVMLPSVLSSTIAIADLPSIIADQQERVFDAQLKIRAWRSRG